MASLDGSRFATLGPPLLELLLQLADGPHFQLADTLLRDTHAAAEVVEARGFVVVIHAEAGSQNRLLPRIQVREEFAQVAPESRQIDLVVDFLDPLFRLFADEVPAPGRVTVALTLVGHHEAEHFPPHHLRHVCAETETAAAIELFRRSKQRGSAFAQQIIECHRVADVVLNDRHHKPHVGANDAIANLFRGLHKLFDLIEIRRPNRIFPEPHPQDIGLILQEIHPTEQCPFVFRCEQGHFAQAPQVRRQFVGQFRLQGEIFNRSGESQHVVDRLAIALAEGGMVDESDFALHPDASPGLKGEIQGVPPWLL